MASQNGAKSGLVFRSRSRRRSCRCAIAKGARLCVLLVEVPVLEILQARGRVLVRHGGKFLERPVVVREIGDQDAPLPLAVEEAEAKTDIPAAVGMGRDHRHGGPDHLRMRPVQVAVFAGALGQPGKCAVDPVAAPAGEDGDEVAVGRRPAASPP